MQQDAFSVHALPRAWCGAFLPGVHQAPAAPADGCPASERLPVKDHKKLADGIYPVYGSGGIMRYVERPLYNKESVLIPRKGTLNNVMYVNQPFWSVDTMFYTEMKLPNVAKFVYHFVKAKDLASMNAGSAVPSMTTDILNAMEVVIPSTSALEEFESLVAPMYEAMEANDVQSKALSQMRDTLLPKLMSGEIDVSAVQL